MGELAQKNCVPCSGGTPKFSHDQIISYLSKISGWKCVDDHHLQKSFKFPDFLAALSFVNRIGEIAEHEQHHPDILLSWGKVEITIFTHTIDGLQEGDFVLADKIDQCFGS